MSAGIEIALIRSMTKAYNTTPKKGNKAELSENRSLKASDKTVNTPEFKQNNDILKEISSYKIDGTIERIASENKGLVDILG